MTVEDTFGRWKGRFPRLSKRTDMKVEGVIHLEAASCILHNISELRRDPLFNEWFQPEDGNVPFKMNARERADASDTRNTLANLFIKEKGRQIYGGPRGTAANKFIAMQTNICGCKQIYIDAKRIKHYVK